MNRTLVLQIASIIRLDADCDGQVIPHKADGDCTPWGFVGIATDYTGRPVCCLRKNEKRGEL